MRLAAIYGKIARAQSTHPWRFLWSVFIVTLVAGGIASQLTFDSSYEALLPVGAPEVENANSVRDRTGGTRQLVFAIEGEDPEDRLAFGRKLLKRIEPLEQIRYVDLEFPMDFLKDRGFWFMDLERLDRLIPSLEEAVKVSKWQANPMALHLDEEEEKRELEEAWGKVDDIIKEEAGELPFKEVLTSKDNRYTFMLAIPSIKPMDIPGGKALFAGIDTALEELDPKSHGVHVRLAGTTMVFHEQHKTMGRDLRNASMLALIFGVLIVAVFSRKATAPLIVGAGLLSGVAWTFAMAQLSIGHINIITGFLVAVLMGLGIDFGIHILIRYQQERHKHGLSPAEASRIAFTGTLPPALTSALTTAGAFLSFTIADFRGFSEFGLIAAAGVLFTLISSFLVLPPLLMVVDRRFGSVSSTASKSKAIASRPIASRAVVTAVVVLAIGWAIYGAVHVTQIPFRNDFKKLRGSSDATEFFEYVDSNLGFGFNPAVVLTKSKADAALVSNLADQTRAARDAREVGSKIQKVFSVADLLPQDESEYQKRISRLRTILDDPKLDRAEKKGGKRAEQLADARRMAKSVPWTVDELPEVFRRRLMTLDGKEYISYIWPSEQNNSDVEAVAWDEELSELRDHLKYAGVEFSMADETLMAAWIYRLIMADAPSLLLLATLVVLLILAIDFRDPKRFLIAATPLATGMLGFVAIIYSLGMELNMFNLIVIPSVIGIGIDNVVHIYHRYLKEGHGSVRLVLKRAGAAAILASATTGVGFGSSLISHHLGLRSLGSLAVIGIAFTLFSATVFFPCFLTVLESRRATSHRGGSLDSADSKEGAR